MGPGEDILTQKVSSWEFGSQFDSFSRKMEACGFQKAELGSYVSHDSYLNLMKEAQWSQGLRRYPVIETQTGDKFADDF